AIFEPTDKSKPPLIKISICASAVSNKKTPIVAMEFRFCPVRNVGFAAVNPTTTAIIKRGNGPATAKPFMSMYLKPKYDLLDEVFAGFGVFLVVGGFGSRVCWATLCPFLETI